MTDRRPARRAGAFPLLAGSAAVAALTAGCSSAVPPAPQPQPAFALTSADVAVAPGDTFPVNLVFVAPDDHPIWAQLRGVAVVGGPELGPAEFEVERGAELDDGALGNLTFSVPVEESVTFEQVDLFLESDEAPSRVEVGSWHIEAVTTGTALAPVGDVALTAEACGQVSASFQNDTAETITAARAAIEAPGVEVTSAHLVRETAPGDQLDLDIVLSCDTTADFYILSPTVTYETTQSTITSRLDPVTIGLAPISADTVDRIASRSA